MRIAERNPEQAGVIQEENGLLVPIELPFQLPTPFYGAMLAIWHLRPYLQRRFPLQNAKRRDYLRFLAWCAAEGRQQYAILRSIPQWDTALSQPIELPAIQGDQWADGFSVIMFFYGISRYRYFDRPVLSCKKVRHDVARSFWRGDRNRLRSPSPAPWQLQYIEQSFGAMDRFVEKLRLERKDAGRTPAQLIEDFGLDQISVEEYVPCSDREITAYKTYPPDNVDSLLVRVLITLLYSVDSVATRLRPRPLEFRLEDVMGQIPRQKALPKRFEYPFGVNLYGYARSEMGLGEDVRLVAQALDSQAIPFCIINVNPGENISQNDDSVNHWVADKSKYAINIFCMAGTETVRYICNHGCDVLNGRYTIGFWPWELPEWPVSCSHSFATVDEIWGISRYNSKAYRRASCPVRTMPLPVVVNEVSSLGRGDFNLPEGDYLFVFSFDFNSTLSRKNPEAVIAAFLLAFSDSDRARVGLVIKVNHANKRNSRWRRLRRIIDRDLRIYLVEGTLRKPDVLALYKCCDCFVSLHRAEGFGLGLAEALLLDLQVIATGYSGNLDFCSENRVGLVRYTYQEVGRLEYFHGDGQSWADPDVGHAAQLMREIYGKPKSITPREFDFSPEVLGEQYARRLFEIEDMMKLHFNDDVEQL